MIIAAYHVTPMSSHSGIYKTYYRIAARFWWPGMSEMVWVGIIGCSLCQLVNAVSHKNQQIFQALPCDGPFDIVSIDVWTPGDIPGKYKN